MLNQSMRGFSRIFLRLLMIFTVCAFGSILFASPVSAVDSESSDPTAILLFAVGDLAQCEARAPVDAPTAQVARLVADNAARILMVGDIAYPKGSATDFSEWFAPVWGEMKARILQVPGNHEYETPDAEPYYQYFGATAGEASRGYIAISIPRKGRRGNAGSSRSLRAIRRAAPWHFGAIPPSVPGATATPRRCRPFGKILTKQARRSRSQVTITTMSASHPRETRVRPIPARYPRIRSWYRRRRAPPIRANPAQERGTDSR